MFTVSRGRTAALAAAVALLASGAVTSRAHASAATAPALFTAAQASAGSKDYETKCSGCHGEQLEGGAGPALSGDTFRTLCKNTKLTVGDLFSFISQQMPLNEPATLTHEQYAAIMAFILKTNGYHAGPKALTFAMAKTSKVRITPK
jgi:mono/diheme cytochrome c family protein